MVRALVQVRYAGGTVVSTVKHEIFNYQFFALSNFRRIQFSTVVQWAKI